VLKALGILVVIGTLGVATIGLAGGGPWWFGYVGSGSVFLLLMLILGVVSNIPSKQDVAQRVASDAERYDPNESLDLPLDDENPRAQHSASMFKN
jgi:hypothetical protein